MSSNVCGNCANFKPAKGAKFFDCTFAQQGGVKYAMQVRPDTRFCEAFVSLKPSPKSQVAVKPAAPLPKRVEPRGGLCNWGRVIMMAALIIIILLIAFGAYTCFKGGSPAVTPTPTPSPTQLPTPGPTPTLFISPTPSPTPEPIFYFNTMEWAKLSNALMVVNSAYKATVYDAPGPWVAPAGTVWVFVDITLTNTSSSSFAIQASNFILVDSSGIKFYPRELPPLYSWKFPWNATAVGPGGVINGHLLFAVPTILSGFETRIVWDKQIVAFRLPF